MSMATANDYLNKLIGDIECHHAEGIKECFANGVDPNGLFNNEPLIYELISEYARTPRFKDCVKVFIDAGLVFEDKPLLAVLADDAAALDKLIIGDRGLVTRRYTLRCAFTPLYQVTYYISAPNLIMFHAPDYL
jgi:hypothetical protein